VVDETGSRITPDRSRVRAPSSMFRMRCRHGRPRRTRRIGAGLVVGVDHVIRIIAAKEPGRFEEPVRVLTRTTLPLGVTMSGSSSTPSSLPNVPQYRYTRRPYRRRRLGRCSECCWDQGATGRRSARSGARPSTVPGDCRTRPRQSRKGQNVPACPPQPERTGKSAYQVPERFGRRRHVRLRHANTVSGAGFPGNGAKCVMQHLWSQIFALVHDEVVDIGWGLVASGEDVKRVTNDQGAGSVE